MAKFKSGTYTPVNREKYIGKSFPQYRSSWEHKFCVLCDTHPSIVAWASEPISIPYVHPITGKRSNYVPDFFVIYQQTDGKKQTEIVEIKPYSQTNPKYAKSHYEKAQILINAAKWKAALKYCQRRGIRFKVINEQNIYTGTKYKKR